MARYHGKRGVIYMSTTGSGTASSVISLNAWTLNMATDKVEVTSFLDTNKTYVQGLRDISGTFAGFYDDTEAKLFTGAASTDGVKLYLYPSADMSSKYAAGPAWVDMTLDTGVAQAVTVSANFAANGSWTINL